MLGILLILIFSISTSFANDVEDMELITNENDISTQEQISMEENDKLNAENNNNDNLLADEKTFEDLRQKISSGYNNVNLENTTYLRSGNELGITIYTDYNKKINGNGAIIDANGTGTIFTVTSQYKITFTNITFKNAGSHAIAFTSKNNNNFEFIDCTFENNNFHPNAIVSGGAAISFLGTVSANSKFTNVIFKNNIVSSNDNKMAFGGALFFNNTVKGCTFENVAFINNSIQTNTTNSYGGAICFHNKVSNIKFKNCNFENNSLRALNPGLGTEMHGAAIYFYEFSNNTEFDNVNFTKNSLDMKIRFVQATGGSITFNKPPSNCNITNCNFVNNSAPYGGGITFAYQRDSQMSNVNLINNTFTDNIAYQAAAIASPSNTDSMKIENVIFKNNHANNLGGACYFGSGAPKIVKCVFENNTGSRGGAIDMENANTFSLINTSFINNKASNDEGGAIYIGNAKNIIGENIDFVNNQANKSGGALYIFYPITGLTGMNFINNTASENGGAIYLRNAGTNSSINNINFNGNSAGNGGALYINQGSSTISDSNFTNNNATSGGAIFTKGNLAINHASFTNNIASDNSSNIAASGNSKIDLTDVESDTPIVKKIIDFKTEVSEIIYGEDAIIKINVTSANALVNIGSISLSINNKNYTANVEKGVAIFTIESLNAGTYTGKLSYSDGNTVLPIDDVTVKVNKQSVSITANNKAYVINYGGKYSITLKDAKGKVIAGEPVIFTLNGKNIGSAKTDSKGVATITLTAKILKAAKSGAKNLIIKFDNNNYNTATKTVKITINKEKTKITAKKKTFKKSLKVKKYKITLKNSKGKAVKKVSVTLKIKSKTYKAKTNKKGTATFKIKKLTKKGKYKAKIKFKGNKYYKAANKKIKITLK